MIRSKLFFTIGLISISIPILVIVYLLLTQSGENLGFGVMTVYAFGWPFIPAGVILVVMSFIWQRRLPPTAQSPGEQK